MKQEVKDTAYTVREYVNQTIDTMLRIGYMQESTTHNYMKCIAIMYADALGDLTNLVVRYDEYAGDDVRSSAISQIGARLQGALFIARRPLMPSLGEAFIPNVHGSLVGHCERALIAYNGLVTAWNAHVTERDHPALPAGKDELDFSDFDRAQSLLAMMRTAPQENDSNG